MDYSKVGVLGFFCLGSGGGVGVCGGFVLGGGGGGGCCGLGFFGGFFLKSSRQL